MARLKIGLGKYAGMFPDGFDKGFNFKGGDLAILGPRLKANERRFEVRENLGKEFYPKIFFKKEGEDFYTGSVSRDCYMTCKSIVPFLRFEFRLPNILESDIFDEPFRERYDKLKRERKIYSSEGGISDWKRRWLAGLGFSELDYMWDYFFNEFLGEEGNIDRLRERELLFKVDSGEFVETGNYRVRFKKF